MSSHYTTEPPPTASVTLHTTAGPIPLSLFATQTPLTTRNFLQHCLDGYYDGCLWHRVVAGFVAQTGDPTGTGEGGGNIYEDREFGRFDREWAKVLGREEGEKIVFGDEMHGRLKFNRRGLLGMAKGADGGYGSQFFVTLGDCRAQLDGKCTMFGRVEGEGVYNMVKIAEGEVDGERPLFPERVLNVEVTQMPRGEAWEGMRRMERVEARVVEGPKKKKGGKKMATKTLLSFGEEGEEGDVVVKPRKAKFNTALIDAGSTLEEHSWTQTETNGHADGKADGPPPAKRRKPLVSPSRREKLLASMTAQSPPSRSSEAPSRRKPSFHEPTTQLPLRDEEMPSRSESPDSPIETKGPSRTSLEAEIAALKASMRRDTAPVATKNKKLSALEAMIPATSTRGRKRPRPGETNQNGREDKNALAMLNAFKARLDAVKDAVEVPDTGSKEMKGLKIDSSGPAKVGGEDTEAEDAEEEEAHLCDLHFIANCQSCSKWDENVNDDDQDDGQDGTDWMSHKLAFGRDQLGKDLNFKKRKEALEELVVIDPREKAGQILAAEREKQRLRKEERRGR